MYYVYKITCIIDGKFYIGKRKHKSPDRDSYMGSGKRICAAIKKHGKHKFKKEIIQIFETNDAAAELEKTLVTSEMIESNMCYNMHEGGHGGFAHINSVPVEERLNIISLRKKIDSGEIKVGGILNHTTESLARSIAGLKRGGIIGAASMKRKWSEMQESERLERSIAQSKAVSGEKNGTYGTHIYIDSAIEELSNCSDLIKNRFIPGEQPNGWITLAEWRDAKKNKKKAAYGRHWYNDGNKNWYLYPTDDQVSQFNLVKGRLKIGNCCGFNK